MLQFIRRLLYVSQRISLRTKRYSIHIKVVLFECLSNTLIELLTKKIRASRSSLIIFAFFKNSHRFASLKPLYKQKEKMLEEECFTERNILFSAFLHVWLFVAHSGGHFRELSVDSLLFV